MTELSPNNRKQRSGCVRCGCVLALVLSVLVVLLAVWYFYPAPVLNGTRLEPATIPEFKIRDSIGDCWILGETYPNQPSTAQTQYGQPVRVIFPDRTIPVSGADAGHVVYDQTGFAIIPSSCISSPVIKFDYDGRPVWQYNSSYHPHGKGILAPRRQIIVFWQFEPGSVTAIDWRTGAEIGKRSVRSGCEGIAIDRDERWFYLLDNGAPSASEYRIVRFEIPADWTAAGLRPETR